MNRKDPTGQYRNRRRTTKKINQRLDSTKRTVLELFKSIPYSIKVEKTVINQEGVVYDYRISPTELDQIRKQIELTLNSELLETNNDQVTPNWWYKGEIEQPYRQGTLEETNHFNQLIAFAAILGITGKFDMPAEKVAPESMVLSRAYREKLQGLYISSFNVVKGLSQKTSSQIFNVINDGLNSNLSRKQIISQIVERYDVSKSNAKRIVYTEVNKAYNDAKSNAAKTISRETGLEAGVIHYSALTPTTRTTHADRHGNAYSVSDQNEWWDQGANRINCKCSVETVLIDSKGNPIKTPQQEKIK